ncbi:MAG TPA: lipopolysaccharide biosynthesis protein [Mucilaginibacter sp.]|nr:lipopolysaccharide biosynthesis protein [Mucilaginibacter sp.]
MNQEELGNKINETDEISVKDFVKRVALGVRYISSKGVTILIFSVIGALSGLAYSIFQRPTYTAVCTFVLEETNKAGQLGQYASLANLAGISLNANGGGIFEGDNILELYKSRSMIETTLLSEGNFNGRKELLIDRYVDNNELRSKWKRKDQIESISFSGDPQKFNRKQDSIISDLVEIFDKKYLSVNKPDKKLNIVDVNFKSNDELFAKEFTDKLVETVNNFYTATKTKKSAQNVLVLQRQADSVKNQLNASIYGVASAIDAAPNANPLLLSLKVPSQKKQIDVQANSAIYAEIVKNLELEKINLRQEAPLIQVIDKPVLPLRVTHLSKLAGILGGLMAGAIIAVLYILTRRFFSVQMQ